MERPALEGGMLTKAELLAAIARAAVRARQVEAARAGQKIARPPATK